MTISFGFEGFTAMPGSLSVTISVFVKVVSVLFTTVSTMKPPSTVTRVRGVSSGTAGRTYGVVSGGQLRVDS
jgi:hypothetical protein